MINNVIVTGATGMIGATLIKKMLSKDINITAIVRPNSPKLINLPVNPKLKIIECDISNLKKLIGNLPKNYDTFFHMAWLGTYGAQRDNVELQEKNVKYTLDAVELAHSCGCKVFVGAGSQAEFGYVNNIITDYTPINPVTGYGICKYVAGKLSALQCKKYGIRQSWGRIISAYGPMDNDYTMVMSSIIKMINGEHCPFTKGEQIWDYIFSDDCAEAFYLIGKYGKDGKAYTIASGQNKPLRDFIKIMRDVVNPELEIGFGELEYYPNQVMNLTADISELVNDTGFIPKTDFQQGIKKCVDWLNEANKLQKKNQ